MAISHVMVSTACCFSNTIILRCRFMELCVLSCICSYDPLHERKGGLKIVPYK